MGTIAKRFKAKVLNANPYILLIAFSALLFIGLTAQYLWTDEVFSYTAGKLIATKGTPLFDTGLFYGRAGIYHQILGYTFKLFGDSIFISRAINIVFAFLTSVVIYKIFEKDRAKGNSYLGLTAATIFITTNFTLAVVRETRMYALAALLLTTAIYFLYQTYRSYEIRDKVTEILKYGVLAAAFILLAYETHALIAALSIGIILFLAVQFLRQKTVLNLTFLFGFVGIFLLGVYLRFNTLNFLMIIDIISPLWAPQAFSKIYYSTLIARNLPIVVLLSPFILYSLFRKNLLTTFSFTLAVGYLAFISVQPAQQERYLTPIIPLLIIMAVSSLRSINWTVLRSKQSVYRLFAFVLFVGLLAHSYLFIKEINETQAYTPTSISIHKKFEFEEVMSELDQYEEGEVEVIADYHSAFTLHFYGYNVKRILVPEDHVDLRDGNTDIYFGIPFVTYGTPLNKEINDQAKDIVIIRDIRDITLLDNSNLVRETEFSEPALYYEL